MNAQRTHLADAGELLDNGPWSVYQKLITLLVAAAIILDGFDIQILAFSLPSISAEWHLPRAAFAPVLAIGLVGMTVGGPLLGYLGDRFGRKPALIGPICLFAAMTIATAFAQSVAALTVLRFLTGFGIGGAVPGATAMAAELAPLYRRAMAVKLTIVCVPLGGMLGGFLAAQVLPHYGWRTLYLIGGCAPLVLAAALALLMPESPRFLAQSDAGAERLRAFLVRAGHALTPGTTFHVPPRTGSGGVSLRELFAGDLAINTTGLWIAFFFTLGGVYLMFGWLPSLLTTQGLGVAAASTGLATYNMGGVIGVLIFAALTSLRGSKGPLTSAAIAGALSALLVWMTPTNSGSLFWGAIGLHGLFANAVQTSLYAVAAHIYPTRIRAFGVSCAAMIGRSGGVLSSLYGSVLIASGAAGFWGALAVAMVIAAFGLATVRRHIPAPARR